TLADDRRRDSRDRGHAGLKPDGYRQTAIARRLSPNGRYETKKENLDVERRPVPLDDRRGVGGHRSRKCGGLVLVHPTGTGGGSSTSDGRRQHVDRRDPRGRAGHSPSSQARAAALGTKRRDRARSGG
ncbi:hypothetical protein AC249_AIPGENE9857, partial [Exaiptasia diaphana]